jgi:excinuclease ABC subunit B
MSHGDKARKSSLVEFGFRLPSAYDNRPLTFEEVQKRFQQVLFVSATPGPWERQFAGGELIEQIIRPTGLLDPKIEVRPAQFQVDDCLEEIKKETENGGKVLVTTLTKHLAEELAKYLKELGCKAAYIHSDIDTLERLKIIHDLRTGVYDVLIGINLLREGLDIPEVQLVVILDADKEGFLRSETSLIQTCGRAARNVRGRVIMYADKITKSMEQTLVITEKRRALQEEYNKKHGITPRNATREVTLLEVLQGELQGEKAIPSKSRKLLPASIPSADELMKKIAQMEVEMKKAAKELQFEVAINLRDSIKQYKQILLEYQSEDGFH